MKVLLIAPINPDLPSIDAEIAAIAASHDVERVTGNVQETDILRAIGKSDYDIIWFATHGNAEGVLLSGSVLSAEGIGQYVSTSGAKLCVLNTCASEDVAIRIIAGGEADMVFTVTEKIADDDALRFGALYAGELAKIEEETEEGEDIDLEDAFKRAAGPGITKYRYLNAKQALRGVALQATDGLEKLKDKMEILTQGQYKLTVDLQALTDRFTQMTNQSQLSQQQSMQAQASAAQVADLDRGRVERQAPRALTSPLSPTFWALVVLIGLVIGTVVFLAGRGF